MDAFLIAGQSNALGASGSVGPTCIGGISMWNGAAVVQCADPVGAWIGGNGSAWPSFGIAYQTIRRHGVLFIPAAIGGSSQCAAADQGSGNWDVTGGLVDQANFILQGALTAAGAGIDFCGMLWCQGERDAAKIADGTITASQYKAAFFAMSQRFRARWYAWMPIYIFRTGTDPSGSDTGFAAIRQAQEEICSADPYTRMVFRDAVNFPAKGWSQGPHYTQAGYNEMGQQGAIGVCSGVA